MKPREVSLSERGIAISKKIKPERRLKKSGKGFDVDVEKNLPDPYLFQRHRELLNKRNYEVVVVANGIGREVRVVDLGIDVSAVSKGLELAYRIKRKMTGDAPTSSTLPTPILQQFIQQITTTNVHVHDSDEKDSQIK